MNFDMTERSIQKEIMDYLRLKGHWVIRVNTGAFGLTYKGKKRYMRTAPKGTPDLIGIQKGTGRFLGIEIKSDKGKVTVEQKETLEEINSHGGLGFVARNLGDAISHGL